MESANSHHHHQLQDHHQFLASSSSSSSLATSPSCYAVGTTTHVWTTPNPLLNTNHVLMSSSYPSQNLLNSRETRQQEPTDHLLSSHYITSMTHPADLAFHWPNTTPNFTSLNQDLRIKEDLADHYYRKYTDILSSNSPSSTDEQRNLQPNDIDTKLFLKSFSSSGNNLMNKAQLSQGDLYSNVNGSGRGGFSQIFPSINVSNLNQTGVTNPMSLDMNLEALDLLTSSRFSGNYGHSSQNQIGILRDGFSYGFDHMQQSHQIPLLYSSNNKVPGSANLGAAEAKRSSRMEPKAPLQSAPKKSRLEARASCPPFKVRKEKLGDRIAALQQLVAPFGKTDTASVLMEAIGYIKFLQNQVETLSVPYMKASRNKSSRAMKGGPADNEHEELKRDLKSRGLCLVPLSCLSYITDGGGAAVWPPPHFGGAT
ncbi:Transcription factor [Sesamum alatum]|uniref:Transcription factor n=1 Tax=Sesamum alatum TaxID=300844 RepID=A0AAE1YFP6_9LAMI|nr:Transcription factor [Sesamum alatum]